ncbi:VOC family protein [Psychromicrobium lacuslunae]|uniref:Glyoxalase n=1 Tax=Psychromicrobium lacuslunae TaxID=1618207 RepID=A0A0D4BXL1_9MICC|nr:VOC family protein [Psychromicrobium lacuslunae]AJT41034.1 glyoxalase [Psychromicrobium lacuslunae]
MTSKLDEVVLDSQQPKVLAEFWCAVLNWRILEESPGGISIAPLDKDWPCIGIYSVAGPKRTKNRLHFDLRANGLSTEEELERLLALGARHADIGQGETPGWFVLADPEGNEFCLMAHSVQDLAKLAETH